jgi:hypothetical protein
MAGAAAGAAAGAEILGTAVSAYGAYQQAQQARKQYQMALQAWQQEQARQGRMDANTEQQQGLNNAMSVGNYAQGMSRDIEDPYIAYARALGL